MKLFTEQQTVNELYKNIYTIRTADKMLNHPMASLSKWQIYLECPHRHAAIRPARLVWLQVWAKVHSQTMS